MTRETKRNLIFLGILIPLMAPGGIILFNKKLNPDERYIGAPDPVRTGTPYMDRMFPGPQMRRVVPVVTERFVVEQLRLRSGYGEAQPLLDAKDGLLPLMSQRYLFQWVYVEPQQAGGTSRVHLLVWSDGAPTDSAAYGVSTPGGPGAIVSVSVVAQSKQQQRALQDDGLIKPPADVRWIIAEVPVGTGQLTLTISGDADTAIRAVPASR